MSTRSEQITSEVRRLVLTCRKLEADLAQSVPKKVLEDTVGKMQGKIDSLTLELSHTRSDLEKTVSTNERLDGLEKQLSGQAEQISSQNEVIKSISSKFDTMVPTAVYEQAGSKIHELEQAFEMKTNECGALQARSIELEQRISQMVPHEQFESVQTQLANSVPKATYEEGIERIRAETFSKEQYNLVESRLAELESQLANSVPRSELENLSQSIISLTKSAQAVNGDFSTSTLEQEQTIGEITNSPSVRCAELTH